MAKLGNEILLAISEGKIPRNNDLNIFNILPFSELHRTRNLESSNHFTRAHHSMNPRAAPMIHRVMESNLFPRIRLSGCRFAINANRVLIIRKSDHQPCFGHVLASTRWPIPRWKWAILGSTLGGTHRYARSCVLRVQNIILDGEEIADEKWNGHIERIFEQTAKTFVWRDRGR